MNASLTDAQLKWCQFLHLLQLPPPPFLPSVQRPVIQLCFGRKMAHLKENIEYPPYLNPFFRRASCVIDPVLKARLGGALRGGIHSRDEQLRNPPVVFHGDAEDVQMHTQDSSSIPSPGDGEGSSQVCPQVGMVFNSVDKAQIFYNTYAEKIGFGSRIGCSRRSQKKGCDHLIWRDFECAHARKDKVDVGSGVGAMDPEVLDEVVEATEATSETQDFGSTTVAGKRKRNKLKRHDCKARMSVGLRKDKWEVTIFIEEHTHPLMSREEWTRYYRSHRKVPYEDYMLIKTLHNRNADTSLIMATLGDLHGTLRTLPYTNRDVTNIRTKLRNEVSHSDMSKTVEYF